MTEDREGIIRRIDERLGALKMSDRQASLAATGKGHVIRNLRNGTAKAELGTFDQLAPTLGTTPEYLAYGVTGGAVPAEAQAEGPGEYMPLLGPVAAGLWLEVDQHVDAPIREHAPVYPLAMFPADWQFAVQVSGTSVNRVAPDGAYLACLDIEKSRRKPRDRELVIVEQRRSGEVSRTAKRFHEADDHYELRTDSTDPKWKDKSIVIERDGRADDEDDVSIKVIGIVTFVHAPIECYGG